jgi:hypothetical protein
MAAMLAVAWVTPLDPGVSPAVLILTLDLDVLTDTWHCPPLFRRAHTPAISDLIK